MEPDFRKGGRAAESGRPFKKWDISFIAFKSSRPACGRTLSISEGAFTARVGSANSRAQECPNAFGGIWQGPPSEIRFSESGSFAAIELPLSKKRGARSTNEGFLCTASGVRGPRAGRRAAVLAEFRFRKPPATARSLKLCSGAPTAPPRPLCGRGNANSRNRISRPTQECQFPSGSSSMSVCTSGFPQELKLLLPLSRSSRTAENPGFPFLKFQSFRTAQGAHGPRPNRLGTLKNPSGGCSRVAT